MRHTNQFSELMIPDDQETEQAHQAACLIASDTADFGVGVMRNLQTNLRSPIRSSAAMQGSMRNIPALIVGAGPSLEQSHLAALQDRALIIAAGTAINKISVRPHLAVAIDQHTPVKRTRHLDVPLCLQARLHPTTCQSTKGELLYLPDSHYAFESWLMNAHPFDGGWTVGNTAMAVAIELGCDPIILIGMDFCYRGKQKYAGEKRAQDTALLVQATDASGKTVWTQRDWLLAISWMERTASAHPERSFYNATVDGMQIGAPFSTISLVEFASHASSVSEQWTSVLKQTPLIALNQDRLQVWKESLVRCKSEESESLQQREFTGEIAAELLLEPLWRIWAPMFERELMTDSHSIPMEQKLVIQKQLFFNQVIQEHLEVLCVK